MPYDEVYDERPDSWASRHGHERAHPYDEFEDDFEDWDGPLTCGSCGGSEERGFDDCEFASHPAYVPGPHDDSESGRLGCPRMTGRF